MTAANVVIATGTTPNRPKDVAFDERTILDSDGILQLDRIPRTMVVVGAGVIGIEYASMFAALGTRVTVVEQRQRLLEFCDAQIVEALQYHLRDLGVTFRFGESVVGVDRARRRHRHGARQRQAHPGARRCSTPPAARARPGRSTWRRPGCRPTSAAASRSGPRYRTDGRAHLRRRRRHRLPQPRRHVDGAGPPRGAARRSASPARSMSDLLPFGIYTIPEISFVGRTEEELTEAAVPVRGRHLALPRARPRPDRRRPVRHAQAARLVADRAPARRARASAPARPSSSTSARP